MKFILEPPGEETGVSYLILIKEPPKDEALLALLKKEENRFLRQEGKSAPQVYHKIRVSYSQAVPLLKELAATGALYFKETKLVVDFFTPGQILPTGHGKWREKEIPLNSVDFLGRGPPHWIIKLPFLRIFSDEVGWSDLKNKPLEVPVKPKAALPLLLLKDRAGAFADLWMDYEGMRIAYDDPRALMRDRKAEMHWEKDLLEAGYMKKQVDNSSYFCPLDRAKKTLHFLLECGWHIEDALGRKVITFSGASATVSEKKEHLLLQGKFQFQNREASLKDVVEAFRKNESFLSLDAQTVGLLPEQWPLEEAEIVSDGLQIKRHAFSLLKDLSWNIEDRTQILENADKGVSLGAFEGTLRNYQQEGIDWLDFLYRQGFHGLLADEMGLGKTVQVLAFLSRLTANAPHLVVVPKSLLFNWRREIQRFLPKTTVAIHHGPDREAQLPQSTIVLTSYGTLRQDLELFQRSDFHCLILDEGQQIKNPDSQTAQAVGKLHARFRLTLTGTPIENRLEELWSQFHFLMPDLFPERGHFSALPMEKIRQKVRPFLLRRRKNEVAKDLPEKVEETILVEMQPEQRALYDRFLLQVRSGLLKKVAIDGVASHRMEILEALLRLRQLCCHPLLAPLNIEGVPTSGKLELLFSDLETLREEKRKVLIYSQFTSMLQIIKKECHLRQWPYLYLDGKTEDRESIVSQFQEDPDALLFFISLKAGGVGLNLTAAETVILFDPWWNEAVEQQAIDRAHRIGQTKSVFVKRYITPESVEEKILKLKESKRALASDLFSETAPITEEELSFLLS